MRTNVTVHDPAAIVIDDVYNRMLHYHDKRGWAANRQRPTNGVLYHYTSVEGLKGIIESHELWATSAYYLNDSAEILYGYRVLNAAFEAWLQRANPPADSISRGMAESLQRFFGKDAAERNVITPVYLTCFCEDDNLLSQWRAYGDSGGYNIGFKVPEDGIVYGMSPEQKVYTARCVKVEYEREKQIDRISKSLRRFFPYSMSKM